MKLPWKKDEVAGVYVEDWDKSEEQFVPLSPQTGTTKTSPVSDDISDMQRPDVPFLQCYEFLTTLPELQSVVQGEIDNIIARDWYYSEVGGDDVENQENVKAKEYVKILNQWESDNDFEKILEYLIIDWSVCGNNLIDIPVWRPVQLGRIEGLERNEKDVISYYWFVKTNGQRIKLDAKSFIHSRYLDVDRQAWGKSKFHSLFVSNWFDKDVKSPKPIAAIWRVMTQDVGKIHHRFAMPRIIYGFKDVTKEVFDKDIKPIFMKIAQGGRVAFNKEFTMNQETVDGKARLTENIDLISNSVQSGSMSARNRLITKPSAMADARVAEGQDDDSFLGDMDRIRRLMNNEIIPRVIANHERKPDQWIKFRCIIEFRWGTQDKFVYDHKEAIELLKAGVVSIKEVREMAKNAGKPLNDDWFQAEKEEKAEKQAEIFEQRKDTVDKITESLKYTKKE
jgi:hypothetical protein